MSGAEPKTFTLSDLRPLLRRRGDWLKTPFAAVHAAWNISTELCFTVVAAHADGTFVQTTDSALTQVGLPPPAGFDAAFSNLHAASNGRWNEAKPGVFLSMYQDGFDASRIAIEEVMAGVPFDGPPVMMIPNRNHLLVARAGDAGAIARMTAAGTDLYARNQDSLTLTPLIRRDGVLVAYVAR